MKLVIGTRGSALALWQARHVRQRLLDEGVEEIELEVIKTRGDKILDVALAQVGGKGLFVKEIEEALIDRRIDLAVHSMKDLPSELPPGLGITGVPMREDARDALVLPAGQPADGLDDLRPGACVGTSSLRRMCQLLARRPDLEITTLRGNVDTRLGKLDRGVDGMEAIVLACAGLQRMGWGERISFAFPPDEMLPAVGQGALGIESRKDDSAVVEMIRRLEDPATRDAVTAERAFLLAVEGGCQVPVGAYATIVGEELRVEAFVGRPDGTELIRDSAVGHRDDAALLGRQLGERILGAGGRAIMADVLRD